MSERYSRRSLLLTAGTGVPVSLSGCLGGSPSVETDQRPTEVPIMIKNNTETEHEVFVEISASQDNYDTTVTVAPGDQIEATTAEGGFCIRAYGRTLNDIKDVTCPAPDESDYSESGYVINLYSSENMDESNQQIQIDPTN